MIVICKAILYVHAMKPEMVRNSRVAIVEF